MQLQPTLASLTVIRDQISANFPLVAKEAPVEPGDAYSFIQRAVQIDSCPTQDCPGLQALKREFAQDFPQEDLRKLAGHARLRTFPFL